QRPPAEPSLPEQAGAGTPEAASTHTAPERAAATETRPRPRSLNALAANTSPEPSERAPAPPERAAPMPTPALTAASGAAEPSATAQPAPASPRDVDTEPSFPTTRLEVICFGGPRVLADGRQIWPSRALGDAKPWEILVFLATQPACGVAREAIANAFWPDDIDADANHRFRQLRYRLRGCLERAVPDLDGEVIQLVPGGRFRLDPSLVTSDAQRFLELVQAARTATGFEGVPLLEQARALYVADLLDAPEARRLAWLDERGHDGLTLRERYRRDLHQVTITLAELYLQLDRLDEAIALFEELTTADPGDEVLWQALFRALAERGDRDGLVREERRMRHALQEVEREAREAGRADGPRAEPSYDTVREYRRLLDALDAPEAATASV
ncbi:MAG TPA: BTAD domain-containing putative transcriptional regulator, partial [Chloroflexota bacterium]|nr:BTAD domain-containing putative transcriptional regulator [Chloroflexota bacterium]